MTPAAVHAGNELAQHGICFRDNVGWDITDVLLDIPSFRSDQEASVETLLASLPQTVTIWGGNLHHPALDRFQCRDLLHYEPYLQHNASITAECTATLVSSMCKANPLNTTVLILGWGRISKYLSALLDQHGYTVIVSARKIRDLEEISRLGYWSVDTYKLHPILSQCSLIINTVPAMILPESPDGILKIDLASVRGIAGDDVLWARGLPGIYAPEKSGKLIAETILGILKEETK